MTSDIEFDIEKAQKDVRKLLVLSSAFKSGIFKALETAKDLNSLSRELDSDTRALHIMLEALYEMGYIEIKQEKYILADKARPIFIEGSAEYIGGYLPHFMNIMRSWLALPDIIKGEKHTREPGQRDVASFMQAMGSKTQESVEETVNKCLRRKQDAMNVLDLGGGPGNFSKAFIKAGLNSVIYDTPEVIEYIGEAFGLKYINRLKLVSGDFTKNNLKEDLDEGFDIIFMANIFHIYSPGENTLLIESIKDILNPGGMIAILDFVRGRSPLAAMFAVNMLANTEGGNTYTEAEYREWLEKAGFGKIEIIDFDNKDRQLITAFLK